MRKLRNIFAATTARLWLIGCGLLLLGSLAYAASSALSNLSAAAAMSDTDLLYVVQSAGTGGLKGTLTQLRTYLFGKVSSDCSATAGGAFTCTKTGGTSFGALATVTPGSGVAAALGNAVNATGGPVTAATGCTSWTPTDQSGASLSFTSVSAQFCQYGNLVFAYGTLTYPSTADGSQAKISTPVAVPNQPYAIVEGLADAGVAGGSGIQTIQNSSTANITNTATGTVALNSALSGKTLHIMLIYSGS